MTSAGDTSYAVELRGVTKAFGPLVANSDVSFAVRPGTIFALVGENGAGKSTCMNLLYGLYQPDSGSIRIGGKECTWRSPRDAIKAGLGMVHQHFMLAGPYTGLDNIILGDEPEASGWRFLPHWLRPIHRGRARTKLAELAATYRFPVDLQAPVESLPVGVQQRLEILKLLYRDANVFILDEPTAVLTPAEVDEFFANLRRLKAQGKTILVITHKLREVLTYADEVAVLRRGRVVAQRPVAGLTESELAELMVGRAVQLTVAAPPPPQTGEVVLSCRGLSLGLRGEKPRLRGIDLEVRGGEVVAIAGIEGNGQSDFLQLLAEPRLYFGHHDSHQRLTAHGQLTVLGHDVGRWPASQVRDLGVGMVPEDRHHQGLLLSEDLTSNFLLGLARAPRFRRGGLIRRRTSAAALQQAIKAFDIRPATPKAKAHELSGGNQQKLIIAREFERSPRLFVCAQPTRGVDVGAIEFIHQRILQARAQGMAVLLVSSELEEVLALADRIVVFYEGRIAGELARGAADEAQLGRLMGGGGGHA